MISMECSALPSVLSGRGKFYQARALEPGLKCEAALLSPQSGVFDSHGYMLALQGEIEDAGGSVVVSAPFEGAEPLPGGGFTIRVGGEGAMAVSCRLLVTAPGLAAQAVAAAIEGYPAEDIPAGHFGKGVYFRLTGKAPFERLVYPPPIHGALGTHYRKDLGGQAVFGPDLAYVETEDYSVDPAKAEEFATYINRVASWKDETTVPEGKVASTFLVAVIDGKIAGRLSIRHRLNDFLGLVGGHIGYGVAPEFRGKSVATMTIVVTIYPIVSDSHCFQCIEFVEYIFDGPYVSPISISN